MPEPDETQQFPEPFGQPSGGQWQYPNHAAQTQPGGQPGAGWPPTLPAGQPTGGHSAWAPAPGPPTTGMAGPPAAKPGRGVATILLGIATAVFLIAAVALGAVYLSERSAHSRTQEQVTTNRSQIDGLQKELDSAKSKLTSAEQARSQQEGHAADLQKCKDAAGEFVDSVNANDEERGKQAYLAMLGAC